MKLIEKQFKIIKRNSTFVAAVKSRTEFISVLYFFWSFGINDSNTLFCIEMSTAQAGATALKAGARGRGKCCVFLYISHEQTK